MTDQRTWAVILAAGDGTRLSGLTRLLHGEPLPKQFARILPDRTLLQATLDRVALVAPTSRTVVVVPEPHRALAEAQLAEYPGLEVVAQPCNLGTGPGLLLGLARIRVRDPDARVVVFPSDHHVARPRELSRAVEAAVRAPSGELVLVGAAADRPETEYGWIIPETNKPARSLQRVACFVEKPDQALALKLWRAGGLWNTFILAGELETFWALAGQFLPVVTELFDEYLRTLTRGDDAALGPLYERMPYADFSQHVLEKARNLLVAPLCDAGWCDWGTPGRVVESLEGTPALDSLLHRMIEGQRRRPGKVLDVAARIESVVRRDASGLARGRAA